MLRPVPKPWENGEGATSFGSWLRQQREIRNITLREISDSTKIGMRYLEALEDDRFEVLPAPVFAKGFLREYARYVGLDADEVVNFYLAANRERQVGAEGELGQPLYAAEMTEERPVAGGMERPRLSWPTVALIAAVVLALLLVYLAMRGRRGEEDAGPPPPIAAPVAEIPVAPTEPPPAAQATSAPLVVTVGFTAECWIEALIDGERRLSELKVQGESIQLEAEREVRFLTIGNASAVRLEVNGRPYSLDGAPGEVVRDVAITLADAGIAPSPPPAAPSRRAPAGARPPEPATVPPGQAATVPPGSPSTELVPE